VSRLDALLTDLAKHGDAPCLVERAQTFTYADLHERIGAWLRDLVQLDVRSGQVVALRSDYSLDSVALLLALLARRCVAALLPREDAGEEERLVDSHASAVLRAGAGGSWSFALREPPPPHPLLDGLRERGSAGFVIFSSGSTGRPKAVAHDIERFLIKFDRRGKQLRTLAFLLLDHVAGVDTLLYSLCAGGTLVLSEQRDPASVCARIAEQRVQVLPTSPSFLRLMLLSGAHQAHDLSSLEIVTCGSEPMDDAALQRACAALPHARIIPKYGTSELGRPRARARDGGLWLDLATSEIEHRVVDGLLWLRSPAAMLGYLNAPDPFDAQGWYCTGDRVERDGSWLRILGRASELINVGGEKLFPEEVEVVLCELPFVRDAAVRGVAHPLLGQVVQADVELHEPGSVADLRKQVRQHCLARLARYKVPVQVREAAGPLTSERQKKRR
jgi:long-chain acyl-CoA synthetase